MRVNWKINWKMLRKQKLDLLKVIEGKQLKSLRGILQLLDALQDEAVEQGEASEEEVFGKATEMRKVYINIKTRLILSVDEGVDVEEVLENMNYSFTTENTGADILDTEIKEWKITDSK